MKLSELKAIHEAATPGEWKMEKPIPRNEDEFSDHIMIAAVSGGSVIYCRVKYGSYPYNDKKAIVTAHNEHGKLFDWIERAEKLIRQLHLCLEEDRQLYDDDDLATKKLLKELE